MAKIDRMPQLSIIAGMKGTLDFYEHKGQTIVRRWPAKINGEPSQPVLASRSRFKYFQKSLRWYSQRTHDLWAATGTLRFWSWHELAYRHYAGTAPLSGNQQFNLSPPKVWPDPQRNWWQVRDAGYYAYNGTNHPYLMAEIDMWGLADLPVAECSTLQLEIWSYDHFALRPLIRFERGRLKTCGNELAPGGRRRVATMLPGELLEWPRVTWSIDLQDLLDATEGNHFCHFMASHRPYIDGPVIRRTVSSGPPFWLPTSFDIPEFPDDGLWTTRLAPVRRLPEFHRLRSWHRVSETHDSHTRIKRPQWWPTTKSQQWGDNPDFTKCPHFNYPEPV